GRVEAAIEGERARVEVSAQGVEVGRMRDQAAPGQLVKDVLTHRAHFPSWGPRVIADLAAPVVCAPEHARYRPDQDVSERDAMSAAWAGAQAAKSVRASEDAQTALMSLGFKIFCGAPS